MVSDPYMMAVSEPSHGIRQNEKTTSFEADGRSLASQVPLVAGVGCFAWCEPCAIRAQAASYEGSSPR